jgi:serine/threonine protein kinase
LEVDNKQSDIGNSMADFKIMAELGRGSYGTVYKVEASNNGLVYVMKRISMKHMKHKQQVGALKEVQILKTLTHPHIIK